MMQCSSLNGILRGRLRWSISPREPRGLHWPVHTNAGMGEQSRSTRPRHVAQHLPYARANIPPLLRPLTLGLSRLDDYKLFCTLRRQVGGDSQVGGEVNDILSRRRMLGVLQTTIGDHHILFSSPFERLYTATFIGLVGMVDQLGISVREFELLMCQ